MDELLSNWVAAPSLRAVILLSGLAAITIAGHAIAYRLLYRLARHSKKTLDHAVVHRTRAPSRILLPLIVLRFAVPWTALPDSAVRALRHALAVALVLAVAWLILRAFRILEDFVLDRYDLEAADNLKARKIHTQIRVLRRIAGLFTLLLSLAVILMMFGEVRQLGEGLLASAGIIGIVVGVAAQRPIGNLITGLQMAITQPIRLGDVVVIEKEWGWIEEITLTYVVVRIWDQRRLMVPIQYFVEKPFENWTRTTSDLLGSVALFTDHSVPIDALRAELKRICEASEHWDGRVCQLQVTDSTERSVELRALVSAADSSHTWDLRCEVREHMLQYLQRNHRSALPRMRAELISPPGENAVPPPAS